jgi:hypothetical protein
VNEQFTPIGVEVFHGQVDASTPLFNRDPGWLKKLQNMRVKPGGYVEARGGYEALKPSGGTSAPIFGSGQFGGFHEHVRTRGAVFLTDNTNFSRDIGGLYYFYLFGAATSLAVTMPTLATNLLNNAIYFGATAPFSYLTFNLFQGTGGTYSVTWEYRSTTAGGSWQTVSSTAPIDFKTAGIQTMEWVPDATWTPFAVQETNLYWIRCRISTAGAVVTGDVVAQEAIRSNWSGRRVLFAADVGVGLGLGNTNLVLQYGQTTGGVAVWTNAYAPPAPGTFRSTNRDRVRFMSYQDRIFATDGGPVVRANLNRPGSQKIGFTAPGFAITHAAGAVAPLFGAPGGTFDYGITFGYGPNGSWGESNVAMSSTGPVAYTAAQNAVINIGAGVLADSGIQDVVHIYRTGNLAGVPVSQRSSVPMFRIASLPRQGVLLEAANTYTDRSLAFPFPQKDLEVAINTPPASAKFINQLNGRVLLAGSVQNPNRAWWSEAGAGESFDQEEDFVELLHPITGMAVAFGTAFVWSEDEMVGVSDLDEDIPNIFEVPGGVGCVAGDAVKSKYGVLIWPSRDGIYFMAQDEKPQRITLDQSSVFGTMSVETHGGSRAEMYDSLYDIHLLTPEGVPVGSAPRWRFDLLKPHWNESTVSLSPLAVVTSPLGHADFGVPHPIFGNVNPSVSDRTPYVGEYTTADAGAGYDCIADIHFGPPKLQKFIPRRLAAYYQADAGWGTPVISSPGTAIFAPSPAYGTPVPKVGTDYKLAVANAKSSQSGSQDIVVRFAVTSAAGGVVHGQRLIAAYLDGKYADVEPTT